MSAAAAVQIVRRRGFGEGHSNPRWNGGVHRSDKGYRRISCGPHRNKYEHRRVMEQLLEAPLCAEYVFPDKGKIPAGLTVEHLDHSRTHNCHANLMLLDERIHNAITWAGVRYIRAHYSEFLIHEAARAEAESVPDWVS